MERLNSGAKLEIRLKSGTMNMLLRMGGISLYTKLGVLVTESVHMRVD